MSSLLNGVDFLVLMALGLVALCLQVWALSDCLRTPAADFQRAYKRTKQFWGALTGVSVFLGFIYVLGGINTSVAVGQLVSPGMGMGLIFNLAAATVASVYLADVRPALAEVRGRGKGRQNRGSSW
ncbi:hypothetical protein QO003_003033 [Arthrobacter silviterrae]|nr:MULTISPECIES: DUF2516 family protein [Arthrobacter]MDQ0278730.1 hypothetical protein [Arthrobacter silviterrae]